MAAPAATSTAPALELRGVGRRFGERPALGGVTLTLAPGATLAVLGRNGAGKTTLLRILATLLRPHAGEARILGEPVPARAHLVRARIGFLAHEPLLYRDLTARENLRYHARLHRLPEPERRVTDALEAVGLTGRADEPVRTLSRGLVQRAAVARATVHRPEILLLDEPRANLDPGAAALLEPLIGRASGRTRVLTSHDPEQALAEADLALGLRDGVPAFLTAAAEIRASGRHRELYR